MKLVVQMTAVHILPVKVGCTVAANCTYVRILRDRFNYCCSATYPDSPTLVSPANGARE